MGPELVDGVTTYVSPDEERERIRRELYGDHRSPTAPVDAYSGRFTDLQLDQYRTQGFVAVGGLYGSAQVDAAMGALSDLTRSRDPRVFYQEEPYYSTDQAEDRVDEESRIRVMRDFCQVDPRLGAFVDDERLQGLLAQLIGARPKLLQETALLKPPFHGAEKPWHQDSAYFDQTPIEDVVGIWIALDEATVDNGCMQIVPGSHLAGPVPHHHTRDCQIDDGRISLDQVTVVPLEPGDALFFSALLHHGTPPNFSPARRRALQFHFAGAHCRTMTIREHADLFDDGGAYAGCRVWDLLPGMVRATA